MNATVLWPELGRLSFGTLFLNEKKVLQMKFHLSTKHTWSKSVYCSTLSTLIICCIESADCLTPYWTMPVRTSAWEIANPTLPLKVSRWRVTKLNMTAATNPVLTKSNHNPKAVLELIVRFHIELWTSWRISNSCRTRSSRPRARIVDRPGNVAERWENTGLRPKLNS